MRSASCLSSPEQVYVTLWSHDDRVPGHVYWVVQLVSRQLMEEFDGAGTDPTSSSPCSIAGSFRSPVRLKPSPLPLEVNSLTLYLAKRRGGVSNYPPPTKAIAA